jgi:hypothetical protein
MQTYKQCTACVYYHKYSTKYLYFIFIIHINIHFIFNIYNALIANGNVNRTRLHSNDCAILRVIVKATAKNLDGDGPLVTSIV